MTRDSPQTKELFMRTFRSLHFSFGSLLLVGALLAGCGSDGSHGAMDAGPVDAARDAVVVVDAAALDAGTDQGPPAGALVHGNVAGLVGTQAVRVRLVSGERLTVPANGAFTFETRVPWDESYEASLDLAPVGSTCELTQGMGTAVEGMETAPVLVTCTPSPDITNPVYNNAFPDPAVVLHDDGYYYAFATTGGAMLRSRDIAHWEYAGNFITNSNGGWDWGTMGAGTWAPDVVRIAGRYVMYYTRSAWGDLNAAIGVAVADHPTGPWDNRGKLFDSLEIGVNNSIDAGVFVAQDGKVYMIWGSMRVSAA